MHPPRHVRRRVLALRALDESMRSMRETKLHQHYTIVTLGAARSVATRIQIMQRHQKTLRQRYLEAFGEPRLVPQPSGTDSCTTNSTSSDQHLGGTPVGRGRSIHPGSSLRRRHYRRVWDSTIHSRWNSWTQKATCGAARGPVYLSRAPHLEGANGGWELALLHVTPRVKLLTQHDQRARGPDEDEV